MKKVFGLLTVLSVILLAGCTKVAEGNYKEGTYFGFDDASKTTAVVYVNENGLIKSVFIDVLYGKKENDTTVYTTKQILGDAYGMKGKGSPVAEYEWYEQAGKIADKVVAEQGIDWLQFKYRSVVDGKAVYSAEAPEGQTEANKKYTDTVAGVSITVDTYYKAVKSALDQAKK